MEGSIVKADDSHHPAHSIPGLLRIAFTVLYLMASGSLSHLALADGKFYYGDQVPRGVPYQRAILFHDGQSETLLIQSSFHGVPEQIGWVVPVPALPEVAVLPEGAARHLFKRLSHWTAPEAIDMSFLTIVLALLILLARGMVYGLRKWRKTPHKPEPHRLMRMIQWGYLAGLVSATFLGLLLPEFLPVAGVFLYLGFFLLIIFARPWIAVSLSVVLVLMAIIAVPAGKDYGVKIHASSDIGPYHVDTVSAQSPEDIISWLREQGFDFTDDDAVTFQNYVNRGWLFVTASVRPGRTGDASVAG